MHWKGKPYIAFKYIQYLDSLFYIKPVFKYYGTLFLHVSWSMYKEGMKNVQALDMEFSFRCFCAYLIVENKKLLCSSKLW